MAFERIDAVQDTATTTGTGPFTMANVGVPSQAMRPFSAHTVSATFRYRAFAGAQWEIGTGTLTDTTHVARSVRKSSNGNALVNFTTAPTLWEVVDSGDVDGFLNVSDVPFSQSVALTRPGFAYMPQYNVTGALSFTPAAGAVKGAFSTGNVIADGVSAVTFPGFKQANGSADYDNRAGILNVLEFSYDGYGYWYAVSQAVGAVPVDTVVPTMSSAAVSNGTPTILTLTASEALDPNNTPPASAFTVTGHTVSAVAVAGTAVNLTVTAFANGEAARTVSYVQPASAGLRDVAGNLMASFGPLAITNGVQPVDTTPPTVSSAQVANGSPTMVQITMTEALANSVPPASAFTVSGGKTATAVAVNGSVVSLACSAPYANGDTITVTYTQPSGNPRMQDAAGNATSSFGPVGVTNNVASQAAATPLRYTNLASLTESGTDPNYIYTGTGTAFNGPTQGGLLSQSLQAGVDGWLSEKITAINGSEMLFFVTPSAALQTYLQTPYAIWASSSGYKLFTSGSNPNPTTAGVAVAVGDIMRMRRTGSNGAVNTASLIAEVSKDNGATWIPLYTWTGVSTGALHFQSSIGGGTTPFGSFANLAASGLA